MRDLQPMLRIQEQMEQTLRPFRDAHLDLQSRLGIDRSFIQAAEIVRANDRVFSLMDRVRINAPTLPDLGLVHQSWLEQMSPIQDAVERLRASSACSLASTVERLVASERLLADLNLDRWRNAFQIEQNLINQLSLRTGRFTASFDALAESIASCADLTALPSFVMPGASREVFTSGHALVSIAPDEGTSGEYDETDSDLLVDVRDEVSGCIPLLERVDPALAKAYRGAREAIESGGTDRARHVLASLRELWGHLLRRLAPDEAVLQHAGNDSTLVSNGRPTRRARVLYICRHVNHAPLSDFVTHDTQALVKMIEIFNRVHQIESGLTDEQLRALVLRTDSWLLFLLQLEEENG
ncbi:MAG: hypothetical protein DYG93_07695 [Leptolyngbya sp. PLA2]|nr:hypothetical protein [Leptolyngbya sp.]MCE7971530.1 hypothetical protein [Leptolyngbya sp. PL-A2]MCQ3940744.1 hypothetical protein [cyanobacterium CYA1]MDL1903714.1 hypothetical protein [Synechococcales cyanobacterium CNB]